MVTRKGYSGLQIGLHWLVAALVLLQFLAADGIEHAWDAFRDGTAAGDLKLAYLHIVVGWIIFALVVWRIVVRLSRGGPELPANEPKLLKIVAHATHGLLYVILLALPVSGSVAWFLGVTPAAGAHVIGKTVLLVLIGLHVAGALFQHFALRSDVLMRMLQAEPR
ncbi:MAG: cytochrome b [Rhizobiaceae bacterium]|nr:cytochrome b [Rhizobiaceae bacterium]